MCAQATKDQNRRKLNVASFSASHRSMKTEKQLIDAIALIDFFDYTGALIISVKVTIEESKALLFLRKEIKTAKESNGFMV